MCGIVGLQVRDPVLWARLGEMLAGMVSEVSQRGPDSAGMAVYGDPVLTPLGTSTVSLLPSGDPAVLAPLGSLSVLEPTVLVSARGAVEELVAAVEQALPGSLVIGRGERLAVLKGTGHPDGLAARFGLADLQGWQGLAHTRMATESAVTPAHAHPFSVGDGLCLVHNGSFANHATIRRELIADGARFDSDNDSEVAARFVAACLADGDDLDKALRRVCERFDGFYTLLVTTPTSFAVVRDAIGCKPALIAQTAQWVAMASEYRALATLPGIEDAVVFEPAPEEVYLWSR
jgi:methylamine---glutamate N-methyltransferase subunit A